MDYLNCELTNEKQRQNYAEPYTLTFVSGKILCAIVSKPFNIIQHKIDNIWAIGVK